MAEPRAQPSDSESRATYEQAIVKGEELFGELESFRVRPPSNELLHNWY